MCVLVVQLLFHLCTHWSQKVHKVVAFKEANIHQATHVLAKPTKKHKSYSYKIVPLTRDPLCFEYCHKQYFYDDNKKIFAKAAFPVDLQFSEYKASKGTSSQDQKDNTLEVPIPTFGELMKEHVLAPFFVFQLFCVLLWMLDEYWQLSVYTLCMLFVFESTVVLQRIQNWKRIKQMRKASKKVTVLRRGERKVIPSEYLTPGDKVLIEVKEESLVAPCDMLLLKGNCSVDESILTGESVPQFKEDISNRKNEDSLNMKKDKQHLILGGTQLLKTHNGHSKEVTCYVLRTGWNTTQGKVMRTILFSSERMTVGSKEAFLFIFILLVFAFAAVGYVVYHALQSENRDPYKLLLKCVMIITSVVPPELPIELALAVNSSILALQMKQIFCTEPFRLPVAGKSTMCCFDKTGTLTDQDFVVKGVARPCSSFNEAKSLKALSDINREAALVIGGCHTLTCDEKGLLGDPIEKAAVTALGATVKEFSTEFSFGEVSILRRFAFNSEVKRMSTVIKETQSLKLVCKGAPEVLSKVMAEKPKYYEDLVSHFSGQGFRVLALAYKELTTEESKNLRDLSREDLEKDLQFSGLLVLQSPIKKGTFKVIRELQSSMHEVCMITGDNMFTAAQVALELNIAQDFCFVSLEEDKIELKNSLGEVAHSQSLCVTGDLLERVINTPYFWRIKVFARVSPSQKEVIVNKLNERFYTVMCGDGTNDVGGLKKAHAGVALLNRPLSLKKQTMPTETIEMGDASIAAHFTSKKSTIKSVKHIIQQGRCTLVTTYQMYKILALNCLVSAYSLSVLYLDGVKFGDSQSTISAICVSAFFFCVSRSKPLSTLSHHKPPNTVFEWQIVVSVFLQFVVQLGGLVYVFQISRPYVDLEQLEKDTEFYPNVFNSSLYLYTSWINGINFLVNYQGLPFMQPLKENKGLYKFLLVYLCGNFLAALQIEPLGYWLELAEMPSSEYSYQLAGVLLGVLGLCWGIEKGCTKLKYGSF